MECFKTCSGVVCRCIECCFSALSHVRSRYQLRYHCTPFAKPKKSLIITPHIHSSLPARNDATTNTLRRSTSPPETVKRRKHERCPNDPNQRSHERGHQHNCPDRVALVVDIPWFLRQPPGDERRAGNRVVEGTDQFEYNGALNDAICLCGRLVNYVEHVTWQRMWLLSEACIRRGCGWSGWKTRIWWNARRR
jgi:hypothetical protein